MLRPVSATFRMVCLKAQITESSTSLNWAGGILKNAEIEITTFLQNHQTFELNLNFQV